MTAAAKFFKWIAIVLGGFIILGIAAVTVVLTTQDVPAIVKSSVEGYLSDATDADVSIGEMQAASLYPTITIAFRDTVIKEREKGEEVGNIGAFRASIGFWDAIAGSQKVRELRAENITLSKAITNSKDLNVTAAGIEAGEGEAAPQLKAQGKFGKYDFQFAGDVQKDGNAYAIPENTSLSGNFGPLYVTAILEDILDDSPTLKEATLGGQNQSQRISFLGDAELGLFDGSYDVEGEIASKSTKMNVNLTVRQKDGISKVRGDVNIPRYNVKDTAAVDLITDTLGTISTINSYLSPEAIAKKDGINFGGQDVDVDVAVAELYDDDFLLGPVKTTIKVQGDTLTAKPISGTLNDGTLEASLEIDSKPKPADMKSTLNLKGWNYAKYLAHKSGREAISGTADVSYNLTAKANSFDGFFKNLNGDFVFLSDNGKFESGALNIWGTGVVNQLFPNLGSTEESNLNCLLADFKVQNSVAQTNALLLDTKKLRIMGQGNVNLANQTLDLKLKPDSKGIEILKIGSAVRVSGPMSSPSIAPDTMGLAKTIGKLALTTVNPALAIISLSDIELSSNHPCAQTLEDVQTQPAAGEEAQQSDNPIEAVTDGAGNAVKGLLGAPAKLLGVDEQTEPSTETGGGDVDSEAPQSDSREND